MDSQDESELTVRKKGFLLRFFLPGLVLFFLICAAFFLWVRTALPSVSFLNARIEKALQEQAPDYRIDMADIQVAASVRHFIPGVRIRDIRICKDAEELLRCPEIFISFKLSELLKGHIQPVRVHIREPRLLRRPQTDTGKEQEPVSENTGKSPELTDRETFARQIIGFLSRIRSVSEQLPFFRELRVQNLFLFPDSHVSGPEIPELLLKFRRNTPHALPEIRIQVRTGAEKNTESRAESRIIWPEDGKTVEIETEIQNLLPSLLSEMLPSLSFLKECRFPLRGKMQTLAEFSGKVEIEHLELRSSGGSFFHPDIWKKPLILRNMEFTGKISDNFSRLHAESFEIALDEPVFRGSGEIRFRHNETRPEIRMDMRCDGLRPEKSHLYWPYRAAAPARNWIRHHLTSGIINGAGLRLRLNTEDYEKKRLPENAIRARVPFQNILAEYYPPLAPARKICGTGEFTAHGVDIAVSAAEVYDTHVEEGRIVIGWAKRRPDIFIEARTAGPADDLRQAVDSLTGQQSPTFIVGKGTARTRLTFDFPLAEFQAGDFRYTAESHIRDILIPDFHGFSLSLENLSASLKNQALVFESGKGSVRNPLFLSKALPLKTVRGRGQILHDPPGLVLDSFYADLKGPNLEGKGFVRYKEEYPHIDANIRVDDLPVRTALSYWPLSHARNLRNRLVKQVASGRIDNAYVRLNMEPQVFRQKYLPKLAVEAHVPFSRLHLDYYPPLPPLQEGAGIITFYADSLHGEVLKGKVGNSRIESANVSIRGFAQAAPEMEIHATFDGPFRDILQAKEDLGHPYKGPEIENAESRTRLHLTFPLIEDLGEKNIQISGSAKIREIRIPDIAGLSFSDGNLTARFGKDAFEGQGNIRTGNTVLTADLRTASSDADTPEDSIRLKTLLRSESLSDFGLPSLPFIKGIAPCSADIRLSPDRSGITLEADLKDTEISLEPAGFHKAMGEAAVLILQAEWRDAEHIRIPEIRFSGDRFLWEGKGDIRRDSQGRIIGTDMDFDSIRFADNDFALHIQSGADCQIDLKGRTLDAKPLIRFLHSEFRSASPREAGSIQTAEKNRSGFSGILRADMKHLQLENRINISSLHLTSQWENSRILSAEIQGVHEKDQQLSFRLSPSAKGSRLLIRSDNAGELLAGLGISENIIGGRLETTARLPDRFSAGKSAQARLEIGDFALVNVPILMQILSTASFVGIPEQLQSGGVAFGSLNADLYYQDHILRLKDGRMEGLTMGMTAEGNINMLNENIEVKGVIVPFNLINKMVGIIPVLGKMIVGDGIIAGNYSVKGSYKHPETDINPLSALAVGSLRNIFRQMDLQKPADGSGKLTDDMQERDERK